MILFNLVTWDLIELDQWVESLKKNYPQTPFIIVGTHADLIEVGIRKQYEVLLKRCALEDRKKI